MAGTSNGLPWTRIRPKAQPRSVQTSSQAIPASLASGSESDQRGLRLLSDLRGHVEPAGQGMGPHALGREHSAIDGHLGDCALEESAFLVRVAADLDRAIVDDLAAVVFRLVHQPAVEEQPIAPLLGSRPDQMMPPAIVRSTGRDRIHVRASADGTATGDDAPVILAWPRGSTVDGPVAGGGARRGLRDQGRAAWPLGVLPGLSGLEPELDGDRRQLELGMMGHLNERPCPIESGRASPDRRRARFERHAPVARPRMLLGRVRDRGTLAAGQLLEPPPSDGSVFSHFGLVVTCRRLTDQHQPHDHNGDRTASDEMLRP